MEHHRPPPSSKPACQLCRMGRSCLLCLPTTIKLRLPESSQARGLIRSSVLSSVRRASQAIFRLPPVIRPVVCKRLELMVSHDRKTLRHPGLDE